MTRGDGWGPDDGQIDELEPRKDGDPQTLPAPPSVPRDRATAEATSVDPPLTESRARDLFVQWLGPIAIHIKELHDVVLGARKEDGTPIGGHGKAFHDVNNNLGAILATVQTLADEVLTMRLETSRRLDEIAEKLDLIAARGLLNHQAITQIEARLERAEKFQ